MRKLKQSTKSSKIVAIIMGTIFCGFVSTLWAFHVLFSGFGSSDTSTAATFAYGFIYIIFSAVGYRTFLYDAMPSYEESFIFFNVIPGLLVALAWGLFIGFGSL